MRAAPGRVVLTINTPPLRSAECECNVTETDKKRAVFRFFVSVKKIAENVLKNVNPFAGLSKADSDRSKKSSDIP